MPTPILTFENVALSFGGVTALDGLSFDVSPDELLAVIGPNGAGKTSIFNCINGVYRPSDGAIKFDGVDVVGRSPVAMARLGVARTFQNLGLFANLNVIENLLLGRHLKMTTGFGLGSIWFGRARREEWASRHHVESVIEFLELEAYRYLPVGGLPYGVQKRIEVGRALAMEPRLLLLDEPAAGMNLEETEDMARYILEIRDLGIPIVLVEHDMHMVMDLADHVVALNFGRKLADGTPGQVRSDPAVVTSYLGAET